MPSEVSKPLALAVDDEPGVLEAYKILLEPTCEVRTAPDGAAALKLLRREDINLVILDLRLPDLEGLEILRRIKEMDERIGVIVATAIGDVRTAVRAMQAGASDYLLKPFDIESLLEAVARTLGRQAEKQGGTPLMHQYPGIFLRAVVIGLGNKTPEGQLIRCVALPWREIIERLTKDPAAAYQIPSRTWEEIIAGAYKKAGFDEVALTPRSGDYGRDIIAVKWGLGSIRIIDQVKAYKPGHLVTADDVRALVGVLHGDGASKGFLTTTSDFAPKLHKDPLIVPFIPSRLELVNGTKLLKRLADLAKNKEI